WPSPGPAPARAPPPQPPPSSACCSPSRCRRGCSPSWAGRARPGGRGTTRPRTGPAAAFTAPPGPAWSRPGYALGSPATRSSSWPPRPCCATACSQASRTAGWSAGSMSCSPGRVARDRARGTPRGDVMSSLRIGRAALDRVTGDLAAAGGVRAVVLDDGSERGIRVLEFRTGGGLRFDVLVERAMDIGLAEFDDHSVGWRSATGFRHPALHENAGEDGLAWLRSMSGLLVTAGLDHILFGGEVDAAQYHYPPRRTVRHGLHGRVANIPARLTGYGERWDGDRYVLWAEGEVRQAAIFGEHLVL